MIGEQERKMGFAGAKATVGSLSGHGGRSNRLHTGIRPDDHLPQKQRVVVLKPAIDGPPSDPDRLTVVKTVDVAASKRQRVYPS